MAAGIFLSGSAGSDPDPPDLAIQAAAAIHGSHHRQSAVRASRRLSNARQLAYFETLPA